VLVGSRGFVTTGDGVRDRRLAQRAGVADLLLLRRGRRLRRERFGGRQTCSGEVLARRTVGIVDGELRRVIVLVRCIFARRGDGVWVCIACAIASRR
jgi:hypothetical protein